MENAHNPRSCIGEERHLRHKQRQALAQLQEVEIQTNDIKATYEE